MINDKKISLVMTTYNGIRFIKQQLDSIREQTICIDEVIICDDLSTDGTYEYIVKYIDEYKLKNWILNKNEVNCGWRNNFYKAIKLSSGDIIFFSDQDDIWNRDKVEIMVNKFIKYKMDALYTDRIIINEQGEVNIKRSERKKHTYNVRKIRFNNSFYSFKTLGCCMCISKKIAELYIKISFPEGGHDSQCGRLALFYDNLWFLDAPTIKYRMHMNNSSGVSTDRSFGKSSLNERIQELSRDVSWINKLSNIKDLDANQITALKRDKEAIRIRLKYLREGGVSYFKLFAYIDCYQNLSMLIGDFAYYHGINDAFGVFRWRIKKIFGI